MYTIILAINSANDIIYNKPSEYNGINIGIAIGIRDGVNPNIITIAVMNIFA